MKQKPILAVLITALLCMAGVLAAQSALSMEGTIVSWTDTGLVVKTDAGEQMIALDNNTKRNLSLKEGEEVTIEYRRNPMGLVIANAVWPTGEYMKMKQAAESRREGMQDTGGDQEQRRTRSNAESWGPGRGLTLTGEVVSWNEESLQVRTTTGTRNVVLTPDTRKKVELRKGAQVAVDFVNSGNTGAIIATQVRAASSGDSRGSQPQGDQSHQGHAQMRSTSNGSSMNQDSDLVILGTVTRFDDDSLILSTADGERTFVITPVTQRVFAYKVGDPVAIEYKIGPDRKMMAESIRQGTRDTGGDQEQRRTRASAESWGPGRGLTLVGEVVSENDEALQVRTTTGIENVVLTQDTRMQGDIDRGDRVAVDYVNDSSTGAIIAEQVRLTTEYSEQDERGDNR